MGLSDAIDEVSLRPPVTAGVVVTTYLPLPSLLPGSPASVEVHVSDLPQVSQPDGEAHSTWLKAAIGVDNVDEGGVSVFEFVLTQNNQRVFD